MLTDAIKSVLAQEGNAAFVTNGPEGPHLVGTWQNYIQILDDATIMFPAGGYRTTEANVKAGSPVQMLISGHNPNCGYRLTGMAEFQAGTPLHEQLKQRFPWCRAAVILRISDAKKVLG